MNSINDLQNQMKKLKKKRNRDYDIKQLNVAIKEAEKELKANSEDVTLKSNVDALVKRKLNHFIWQKYERQIIEIQEELRQYGAKEIQNARNERREASEKRRAEELNIVFEIDQLSSESTFLTVDMERYEFNQNLTLEVGICFGNASTLHASHYIVEENQVLRNGKHCPDKRENFNFGTSKILPLDTIMDILLSRVESSDHIIGHGFENDKIFLRQDVVIAMEKKGVINAQIAYKMIMYKQSVSSVGTICKEMNIQTDNLHNAGNDAAYTFQYFMELLMQRR